MAYSRRDCIDLCFPQGSAAADRDDREAGLSHTEADSHEHRGEIFRRALLRPAS